MRTMSEKMVRERMCASLVHGRRLRQLAADGAFEIGGRLGQLGLGADVLEVDGLDVAHRVEQRGEVGAAGLIRGLGDAQRLLRLGNMRARGEAVLQRGGMYARVCLDDLAPHAVLPAAQLSL